MFPSTCVGVKGYLAFQNRHPRDDWIVFDEEPHVYYIDYKDGNGFSSQGLRSATSFVHHYFPTFDKWKVATRMKSKEPSAQRADIRYKTVEEIVHGWDTNGVKASAAGSRTHELIEDYLNAMNDTQRLVVLQRGVVDEAFQMFLVYASMHPEWVRRIFRTEQPTYTAADTRVPGSIDASFVAWADRTTSTLWLDLCDWKRSKEIKLFNAFECGHGCCEDLMSVNFNYYMLQLGTYQYTMEQFYDGWTYQGHVYDHIKIRHRYLLVFHPDNPCHKALKIDIPDCQERIRLMMEDRRQKLLNKQEQ
jgi:hypothetical protein